jgi:hypothetical protein
MTECPLEVNFVFKGTPHPHLSLQTTEPGLGSVPTRYRPCFAMAVYHVAWHFALEKRFGGKNPNNAPRKRQPTDSRGPSDEEGGEPRERERHERGFYKGCSSSRIFSLPSDSRSPQVSMMRAISEWCACGAQVDESPEALEERARALAANLQRLRNAAPDALREALKELKELARSHPSVKSTLGTTGVCGMLATILVEHSGHDLLVREACSTITMLAISNTSINVLFREAGVCEQLVTLTEEFSRRGQGGQTVVNACIGAIDALAKAGNKGTAYAFAGANAYQAVREVLRQSGDRNLFAKRVLENLIPNDDLDRFGKITGSIPVLIVIPLLLLAGQCSPAACRGSFPGQRVRPRRATPRTRRPLNRLTFDDQANKCAYFVPGGTPDMLYEGVRVVPAAYPHPLVYASQDALLTCPDTPEGWERGRERAIREYGETSIPARSHQFWCAPPGDSGPRVRR